MVSLLTGPLETSPVPAPVVSLEYDTDFGNSDYEDGDGSCGDGRNASQRPRMGKDGARYKEYTEKLEQMANGERMRLRRVYQAFTFYISPFEPTFAV